LLRLDELTLGRIRNRQWVNHINFWFTFYFLSEKENAIDAARAFLIFFMSSGSALVRKIVHDSFFNLT
jgi:hypothetical protein